MKRLLGIIMAVALLAGCCGVFAEEQKAPDFILEGYDGENTYRTWETNLFFRRMEERTGISFEFREYTSYTRWKDRKSAIAKKEDLPEVLFKAELGADEVRDLYEAGVLIDLRPYLEENAPNVWKLLQEDPDTLAAVTMPDGAIPALPSFNSLQNNSLMWINRTWLKAVKMEAPTTAEELTEVLRAFRDGDPNRNGRKDEVPLTFIGMWELRFLGHAFGITDNDYYVSLEDGKVTSALTSDRNRAFLEWLHMLWEEGLLDHNGFAMADSLRRITDENATIPYGMMMANAPSSVIATKASANYALLLPLQWEGKQTYRSLTGNMIRGTFALTVRCKDPARMLQWVDYLYTEEGSLLAMYGLEGQEYSFRDDGMWEWNEDQDTVTNYIVPMNTIRTLGADATAPGIMPVEFTGKYGDEETREDIQEVIGATEFFRLPIPPYTMTREDQKAVNDIQAELSPYAETTMARFVTGDIPLDDENWKVFCDTAEEKGLSDMIAIWQKYAK